MSVSLVILTSLFSGVVGSALTIGFQWLSNRSQVKCSVKRLKQGLKVACVQASLELVKVKRTYKVPYDQNPYRVDLSMFEKAHEAFVTKYTDVKLLFAVSAVLIRCRSLNRLWDVYEKECFESSSNSGFTVLNPPTYILTILEAVHASIADSMEAMKILVESIDTPKGSAGSDQSIQTSDVVKELADADDR